MALGKSISFVKKFLKDKEFRRECNQLQKQDLMDSFGFDETEFDDAINMELVKCQTWEDADRIQQVKFWFALL